MSVTAKFVADFSNFQSAVEQAETKLVSFQGNAGRVESALNRMVDNFSGRKVIQDATLMAEAVDRIGGASKLTEDELLRVGAKAQEAADKLRAMGQDVPPKLQDIADAAAKIRTEHEALVGTLKDVAGAFGLVFSVGALVEFVGNVTNSARQLRNLSLETKIGTDALQVLAQATKDYGIEGEQLGRAIFQLQQRIAGNDQSVVTAFALMGKSIDDVKNKNPLDLFLETERGLGKLSGSLQDVAAKDLFGGRLGASLIAFSANVDEAITKAGQLNKASGESVRASAEAADAFDRLKKSLQNMATEGIGQAVLSFEDLHKAVEGGASKWSLFIAGLKDAALSLAGSSTSGAFYAKAIQDATAASDANTKATAANAQGHKEAAAALDQHAAAAQFMATLEINAAKPILEWQVEYLGHLKDIGQLTAQNAAAIGVNSGQLEKYKTGLEAAKIAAEALAKAQHDADQEAVNGFEKRIQGLQKVTEANLRAYDFSGQVASLHSLMMAEEDLARAVYNQINSERDRAKIVEELTLRRIELSLQIQQIEQKQAQVVNAAIIAELAARKELEASYGRNIDGTIGEMSATEKLTVAMTALHNKRVEGISQYYEEQVLIERFTKSLYDEAIAQDTLIAKTNQAAQASRNQAQAITDTAAAAAKGRQDLANFLAAAVPTSDSLTKAGIIASTQSVSGFTQPVAARAEGGPVSAGSTYLVGERGPELYTPGASGSITPNGGVTVHINVSGVFDPQSAAALADVVGREIADRTGLKLRAS